MRTLVTTSALLSLLLQVPPGQPSPPSAGEANEAAALAFARALASDERTPEFSIALRRGLALAEGLAVPAQGARRGAVGPSRVDDDARYLDNQARYVHRQDRIIGGRPVRPGDYPETVAVLGNGRLCTGTLIRNDAVLTAAHCFCQGAVEQVVFGEAVNAPRETISVKRAAAMVGCDRDVRGADLAVLLLDHAASTEPATVASASSIDGAADVIVVGFGRTANPIADPSGIKREVGVPVASPSCGGQVLTSNGAVADSAFYDCVSPDELVAGAWALDRDSCNGDSGGPVFVSAGGRRYLAAATSRATGAPGVRPCGDGGVYSRIGARALDWLRTTGVVPAVQR